MDKKHWFAIFRDLSWLTQFGFSVASPPILCLLAAWWLTKRFSLGGWVYVLALVLGVGTSVSSFRSFLRYIQRKNGKNHKE